uniref:Uncharacterized protein n=1 Tax=Rousettus aegyptiacus TaxID=9407 RepID=A0A7J8H1T6_ROUAE|nr:hypothetical protein HJG63_011145 [Rousettus aegyptiacus]
MKNFYVVVLNCVFKKLYMIILTFFHGMKTCKNMLSRRYVIFQRGCTPVYRPRVTIPALPILPAATDDGRLPRPICRFAGNTRGMSVAGGFPAAPSAERVSQPWSWSTARDGQPRGPARLRPLRSLALQVNHTALRRTRQPGSPESPDFWPPPAKQPPRLLGLLDFVAPKRPALSAADAVCALWPLGMAVCFVCPSPRPRKMGIADRQAHVTDEEDRR